MNEEEGEMLEGKKRGEEKVPWRAKLETSSDDKNDPTRDPGMKMRSRSHDT